MSDLRHLHLSSANFFPEVFSMVDGSPTRPVLCSEGKTW